MSPSNDEIKLNRLTWLLENSTDYYILLFNDKLYTDLLEHEKALKNIDDPINNLHQYFVENDIDINVNFAEFDDNIFFWGKKIKNCENIIPILAQSSLTKIDENYLSKRIHDSEELLLSTFSDLYNVFAVNIGDDFLFSYLIGTLIKLANAEVGLLQIFKDGEIINFSMGFKQKSLDFIQYHEMSIIDYLHNTKSPILIENVFEDPDLLIDEYHAGMIKSLLIIPIFNKGEMVAVIYLINKRFSSEISHLDEEDLQLISTLSINIGSVISNALLYKKTIELKEFNEEMLENIPSGILTTSKDDTVLFTNKYMRNLLNKLNINAETLISYLKDKSGKETFNFEFNLVINDEINYLKVSKRLLQIGNGGLILLYTINDITQEKELESQLRKTERLASAGELISGIAHEIKNPLTSMKGFADLLAQRIDDKEFVMKFASIVTSEINRLNNIIERFLSFAKPNITGLTFLNLKFLINEAIEIVSFNIKRSGIELEINIDEKLDIYGSREMLLQVFINLILNAAQALELSTKEEKKIIIYSKIHEKNIEITVEDNGPGIEDNLKEKIFNPFYTTKPSGSGLGLSITHKIITEHKGFIKIDSKLGEYTKMKLFLPIKKKDITNHEK